MGEQSQIWAIALAYASDVARHHCLDVEDVLTVADTAPVGLPAILETPQGWVTLGMYCSDKLGGRATDYLPTIH